MSVGAESSGSATTRRRVRNAGTVVAAAAVFAVAAGAGVGAFGDDVGPPAPRISSGPGRVTMARSATFDVDAAPSLALACALDGSEFVPCTSPATYRALALGDHEFRVRARAATGPWSSTASYSWRIVAGRAPPAGGEGTVPRPVLTTTPMRPYVSQRATFAWRAPAGRSWRSGTVFACSLDGRPWSRCGNPKSYGRLGSGPHVFRVRAELRGRRGPANRFGWTIELAAPEEPTITPQQPATTDAGDASFSFGEEGAAGFECRLDGGSWERCASPVVYVGLAPGRHEFCVRAVSATGVAGRARCFEWVRTTPSNGPAPPSAPNVFTIFGDLPTLLRPDHGGVLPLTVSNPNGFDLRVSDLVVTVRPGSSRPGCDGPSNLRVVQSNAALGVVSIVVPAHRSVTLPAQGATAPELEMLDLSAAQDACKGAVFTLAYSGTGTRAG